MRIKVSVALLASFFILIFLKLHADHVQPKDQPALSPKTEESVEPVGETTARQPVPLPTPVTLTKQKLISNAPTLPLAAVSMNVGGHIISIPASNTKSDRPKTHDFSVEDGVAVMDGDIVMGVPSHSAREGTAELPTISFWPTRTVPYFIQPSLEDPSRVVEALEFFSATAVRFVAFTDQDDALVFQTGSSTCKSYVGRTGGHQPIWIAPECGAHEIAHEIMHALGFTHEQNRFDRDKYIRLNPQNIDQTKIANFQKMPEEFMQLSGLSEFSFNSIMIYPPAMFSRTGQPTMVPLRSDQRIEPSHELSDQDVARINKFYGAR